MTTKPSRGDVARLMATAGSSVFVACAAAYALGLQTGRRRLIAELDREEEVIDRAADAVADAAQAETVAQERRARAEIDQVQAGAR